MKNFFAAGFFVAALASAPALAADMPIKAPAMAAPTVFTWTGFYVGAEGGWGRGRTQIEGIFGGGPLFTPVLHDRGGIAGGTLGYNWQNGALVLGIEGDASWADIDPVGHDATVFPACTAGGLGTCGAKLSSVETLRGRAGIALGNNILVYGTGGAAFGDIKATVANAAGIFTGSSHKSGWTAGGGIEVTLGHNWSVKAEYLVVDLGDGKIFPTTGGDTARFLGWKADIVRLGLNYKFGDPWGKAPVVAKY